MGNRIGTFLLCIASLLGAGVLGSCRDKGGKDGKGGTTVTRIKRKIGPSFRGGGRWTVQEDIVIPAGMKVSKPVFSADGRHIACATTDGRRWRVIVDGRFGPWHQAVAQGTLHFSAGGESFCYMARERDAWSVVTNGRGGPVVDGTNPKSFVFGPKGRRLTYVARRSGKQLVVIDGRCGPKFEKISWLPQFACGGRRVAYVGVRGGKKHVVVDGNVGPPWDEIQYFPGFSPDGRHWWYVAKKGALQHVVFDGRVSRGWESVGYRSLDTDGNGMVYGARDGNEWFLVRGEDRIGPFEGPTEPQVTGDGRLMYIASRNGKQRLVVGASKGPPFDYVMLPKFSHDGKTLVYRASRGERQHLVVNGTVGAGYEDISKVTFSPGGGRVAYIATISRAEVSPQTLSISGEDRKCVVVDGKPGPIFGDIDPPIFSPDGKRVAYLTGHLRFSPRVVVDHKPSPEYRDVERVEFSPDSKRFAYVAEREDKKLIVVVGKAVYGPYEDVDVVADRLFHPDGRVVFSARRDGKAFVVIDGREGPAYRSIYPVVFAPDGRIVYGAEIAEEKEVVVVDGVPGPIWNHVTRPHFSRDGRYLAYLAVAGGRLETVDTSPGPSGARIVLMERKGGVCHMVVAGEAGPAYERIVENRGQWWDDAPALFGPDGVVTYFAIREGATYRVRHVPPEAPREKNALAGPDGRDRIVAKTPDPLAPGRAS